MRLFIAIPLPAAVKQHLEELEQPIEGVRWQHNGQYHLTLKFLGETEDSKVSELQQELANIQPDIFAISLKGFGYFPQGRHPKVLWAGIKKSHHLLDLHKRVEKVCQSFGFEPENRDFKPHVTLARMNGVAKRDVMSFINQHKQFQIPNIPVEEFVLYESRLHSDGAMHIRLRTFPLHRS